MTIMRPIRTIATALLAASLALTGCARSQPNDAATDPSGPPAVTAPPATNAFTPDSTNRSPVVLVDGRHTVYLKTVDPSRRTIRFDLIQFYGGEEALREATKDHPEASPDEVRQWVPNDFYIRNLNPKLRTLPTRADAVITVNNLLNSHQSIPVTLSRLTTLTQDRSPVFWITVRHGQVLKISEQWVP